MPIQKTTNASKILDAPVYKCIVLPIQKESQIISGKSSGTGGMGHLVNVKIKDQPNVLRLTLSLVNQ